MHGYTYFFEVNVTETINSKIRSEFRKIGLPLYLICFYQVEPQLMMFLHLPGTVQELNWSPWGLMTLTQAK